MAGSSLLLLIDDIASVMDDVALMTKLAAKKTAGVLGDDLALNAQQVSGVQADRELPVVWAVAKGSLKNKVILVPLALLISAVAPVLVMPLLMLGGLYLCYEGVEKLAHRFTHSKIADRVHHDVLENALLNPATDILAFEKTKIQGAIRTDFILSAEIVTITLGTVAAEPLSQRVVVLVAIALIMTVGVYGLVAGIVKLDDLGIALNRAQGLGLWAKARRFSGRLILSVAPYLMRFLSVAGTAAMFLVGGGILVHGLPFLHALSHDFIHSFANDRVIGSAWTRLSPLLLNAGTGVLAGALVLFLKSLVTLARTRVRRKNKV